MMQARDGMEISNLIWEFLFNNLKLHGQKRVDFKQKNIQVSATSATVWFLSISMLLVSI